MRKLEMGTVLIRVYLTNQQISQTWHIFSYLELRFFLMHIIKVSRALFARQFSWGILQCCVWSCKQVPKALYRVSELA
jgi:hypothetical protein